MFVGNIPYSATEEQLEDVFRTVGHVVSFRFALVRVDLSCTWARMLLFPQMVISNALWL